MMGWDGDRIQVAINVAGCGESFEMTSLIDSAMAVWNNVLGGMFELRVGNISATSVEQAIAGNAPDSPLLICDAQFMAHTRADGNTTPGQTSVLLDTSVNHLIYGYTLLNAEPGTLANIERIPEGRVAAIVAHELGHLIGLGHSPERDALMYYDVSNKRTARLSADDAAGAVHLYTDRPDRTDDPMACGQITRDGSGPGSSTGILNAAFALFLAFAGIKVLRKTNV